MVPCVLVPAPCRPLVPEVCPLAPVTVLPELPDCPLEPEVTPVEPLVCPLPLAPVCCWLEELLLDVDWACDRIVAVATSIAAMIITFFIAEFVYFF